jgi:hypothetical protein
MLTVPAEGVMSPSMVRISTDLPQPFDPNSSVAVPSAQATDTSEMTSRLGLPSRTVR